jgi:hypothetical protein
MWRTGKKTSIGFSPKNATTNNDLFGTVNILKAIFLVYQQLKF